MALAPLAKPRPPLRPWPGWGAPLSWSCRRQGVRHRVTWGGDEPLASTEHWPLFPSLRLLKEGPQESVSSSRVQPGHV